MTTTKTEQGFAHVLGLAVVVVVLAIIGFAGYKVMQSQKSNDNTPAATTTTSAVQTKINAQPTLKTVDQTLNDATTALNSGFSTTTLDSDIQALY